MKVAFEKIKSSRQACPICQSEAKKTQKVVVAGCAHMDDFNYLKCEACGSYFIDDFTRIGSYEQDIDERVWRYYVEIGAGIDSMIRFASQVDAKPNSTFVDVGCGFGFVVDYWRGQHQASAIGLESAGYGHVGKKILGADIHHEYLDAYCSRTGDKFDIVYSSEVIEHVPAPVDFARQLREAMSEDGCAIFTTPSSSAIAEENDIGLLTAVLFPGHHYFVMSAGALEEVLRKAGFRNVQVTVEREKLIALASMSALPVSVSSKEAYDRYIAYLGRLKCSQNSVVRGGAYYRLFKEHVNSGDWSLAKRAKDGLCDIAKEFYGFDLENVDLRDVLRHDDYIQYGLDFAAWCGSALFYLGMFYANGEPDLDKRLRFFQEAVSVLEHEIRLAPQYTLEPKSLIDNAKYHFSQALLMKYSSFMQSASDLPIEWKERVKSDVIHYQKEFDAVGGWFREK